MSNTWDYRFAFHLEGRDDVPPEFRGMYHRLLASYGPPVLAMFSPAMEDSRFIFSKWLPPKLILVFAESLALLSLDTRSNRVHSFELFRKDLLAYGQAEFLLSCWFTLYPGPSEDKCIQIRFPSRASGKFVELARLLLHWLEEKSDAPPNSLHSPPAIPGLPKKFLSFLDAHAEYETASEFFFQPAMDLRGMGRKRWSNLLLVSGSKGVLALTDQRGEESSEYGIETTYLPYRRIRLVDWVEPPDGHRATVEVHLKGAKTELSLAWPVFPGLRPYGRRWLSAVKSSLNTFEYEPSRSEGLADGQGEQGSGCESALREHDNHAR